MTHLFNTTGTVMGVVLIYYQVTQPTTALWGSVPQSFDYPFFAISPSLNIILTLMIVVRLVVHQGRIRNAMGPSATTSKWYMAVVTILVESCALYAVSFILFLGPWGAGSSAANIFFPVVAQTQVRTPFFRTFLTHCSLGDYCLIILSNRSSPRFSSFNASPIGKH